MNNSIYIRLVEECNRQHEALQSDSQTVNLVEHKMLSNCLDCMEYMDKNYSIDLDCSEVSLEVIDIMFENAHEAYMSEEFDYFDLFTEMFAGYVAMVIKNELGGNFVYDENGEALNLYTNHIDVHALVKKCIVENKKISEQFKGIKEALS